MPNNPTLHHLQHPGHHEEEEQAHGPRHLREVFPGDRNAERLEPLLLRTEARFRDKERISSKGKQRDCGKASQ